MTAVARFAYDKSGSILACADGAEVLVYSGSDESPMWRASAPSPVVALATTPGEVLALDDGGRLSRFATESGAALGGALELGGGAGRDLAVARDGTAVALVGDRVEIVAHGARARTIAAAGGRAVALTDDGQRVAILTGGALILADTATGAERGRVTVDAAAGAVAWCVRGFFVVASGSKVVRVGPEGGEPLPLVDVGPQAKVRQLSASADGGILALLGEDDVKVVLLATKEVVGRFGYERPLEAVAFGPDVWLGIGLDRGDANRINLVSGACHRTDPHEGRARTTWTLSITLDTEKVRQARATANPSAAAVQQKLADKQKSASSSSQPPSSQSQSPSQPSSSSPAKSPEPAPPSQPGGASSAPLFIALGVVAVIAVAVALWLILT